MKEKKSSVVIPTYNKKERLALTLESFRYQTASPDTFEVIVVDDGSTDGTKEMLENWQGAFELRYIFQNNGGRSMARNRGIQEAQSELIIFCDDDLIASKEFVEAHQKAHERKNCMAHGIIYNLPFLKFFKNPSTGEMYEGMDGNSLVEVKKYCIQKEDIKDIERIKGQSRKTLIEKIIHSVFEEKRMKYEWLSCTGANFSCEKKLLIQVGLFDERLGKKWGAEDFELGYRLFKQQIPFVYLEDACNYHMMHARMDFKEALEESSHRFYELHPEDFIYFLPKLLSGEIRSIENYESYINLHKKSKGE